MKEITVIALALVTASAAVGCGGGGDSPPLNASIYRSFGSLQCTGGGTSLAAMERQLADAGVTVLAAACGADGFARPAVCGAADGRIGILDIPTTQLPAAAALGFQLLAGLPSASRTSCS
ncbi:MAG: hypothetical protein ABIU58_13605 [Ramlibacter sp.]